MSYIEPVSIVIGIIFSLLSLIMFIVKYNTSDLKYAFYGYIYIAFTLTSFSINEWFVLPKNKILATLFFAIACLILLALGAAHNFYPKLMGKQEKKILIYYSFLSTFLALLLLIHLTVPGFLAIIVICLFFLFIIASYFYFIQGIGYLLVKSELERDIFNLIFLAVIGNYMFLFSGLAKAIPNSSLVRSIVLLISAVIYPLLFLYIDIIDHNGIWGKLLSSLMGLIIGYGIITYSKKLKEAESN